MEGNSTVAKRAQVSRVCNGLKKRQREVIDHDPSPTTSAVQPFSEKSVNLEWVSILNNVVDKRSCKRKVITAPDGRVPDSPVEKELYTTLLQTYQKAEEALTLPYHKEKNKRLPVAERLRSAIANSMGIGNVYLMFSRPFCRNKYPLVTGELDTDNIPITKWSRHFNIENAVYDLEQYNLLFAERARTLFTKHYHEVCAPLYNAALAQPEQLCEKTRSWVLRYRRYFKQPELQGVAVPCLMI